MFPQCGSVRVDSLDDFAYGSEILVNTTDKVMDVRTAGFRRGGDDGCVVMMSPVLTCPGVQPPAAAGGGGGGEGGEAAGSRELQPAVVQL